MASYSRRPQSSQSRLLEPQISYNHFFSDAVQSVSYSSKISIGLLAHFLYGCLYLRYHEELVLYADNVHSFPHDDILNSIWIPYILKEQDMMWYVVWSYWNKKLLLSLSCATNLVFNLCWMNSVRLFISNINTKSIKFKHFDHRSMRSKFTLGSQIF